MSKPVQTVSRPHQCVVCSKSFKTQQALATHSLGTGHGADRYCRPCLRLFGSLRALEQHIDSPVHAKSPVLTSPSRHLVPYRNSGTNSSLNIGSLSCRGNDYSHLSTADQSMIYGMLVSSCHPQSCLNKQRYALRADPPGESGAANASEWTESEYLPAPKSNMSFPKRKAVVLDCEMAGVEGGQSVVVLLCAIDFLTGEVLVNSLVKPRQPVVDWRSNISGVTPAIMSIARARGQALDGWQAARAELWRHINEDTILVGQSLNFDLQALRVVHSKIVDSAILTAEAVFGQGKEIRRMWGLKALCEDLVGLRIRDSPGPHDGLEDALAARELVLWCLRHPAKLKTWAIKSRGSFWRSKAGRRVTKEPKRKVTPKAPWEDGGGSDSDDDGSAGEVLQWDDVISDDMWPKSPPDSD